MAAIPASIFAAPFLEKAASAIFGSVISGFGRRVESAFAGEKGRADYATTGAAQQALSQAGFATTQARSQGQAEAFQASQAQRSQAAYSSQADTLQRRQLAANMVGQSAQHAHEKSMLGMELSHQGDGSSGQVPWWMGGGPGPLTTSPAGRSQYGDKPANVPQSVWDSRQYRMD